MEKSADAFRTISEAAEDLDLPQHVLRFWETRFTQIKPMKRGGGRRYYRPEDMELLHSIRYLLYGEGYTIKGVQRILKEQGVRAVLALRRDGAVGVAERREPALEVASAMATAEQSDDDAPEPERRELEHDVEAPLRAALAEIIAARRVLEAARGL